MDCLTVRHNLVALVEKTVSPDETKALENHISSCHGCQELYSKFSSTYHSLDHVASPELNPFFYTRIKAKLENQGEQEIVFPWPVVRALRPLAAGLAVLTVLTFSIVFGNYYMSSTKSEAVKINPETLTSFSNEYYLDNNEEAMVDLFINNNK